MRSNGVRRDKEKSRDLTCRQAIGIQVKDRPFPRTQARNLIPGSTRLARRLDRTDQPHRTHPQTRRRTVNQQKLHRQTLDKLIEHLQLMRLRAAVCSRSKHQGPRRRTARPEPAKVNPLKAKQLHVLPNRRGVRKPAGDLPLNRSQRSRPNLATRQPTRRKQMKVPLVVGDANGRAVRLDHQRQRSDHRPKRIEERRRRQALRPSPERPRVLPARAHNLPKLLKEQARRSRLTPP